MSDTGTDGNGVKRYPNRHRDRHRDRWPLAADGTLGIDPQPLDAGDLLHHAPPPA